MFGKRFSIKSFFRNFSKKFLGKNFWKNYFKVYDVLNESYSYQTLLKKVVQEAQLDADQQVLDAGCGTGNLIPLLQKNRIEYIGIDIIPEALEIAQKKIFSENIKIEFGDISKKSKFQSNTFDRIISINVFYILSDKGRESALKEFHRILKPGGKLIIATLKKGFDPKKIYIETLRIGRKKLGLLKSLIKAFGLILPTIKMLFYNQIINNKQKKGAYKYFSREEIKDLLSKNGFKEVKSKLVYAGQGILVSGIVDK